MLHSFLIVGGDDKTRAQKVKEIIAKSWEREISSLIAEPDFLILSSEGSLGIAETRKISQFLKNQPYQRKSKVVLVENSEKLTIEAQNNLLKTLEEPPARSLIIMTVDKTDSLLTTIISRCQIIRLANKQEFSPELSEEDNSYQAKMAERILLASAGERLNLANEISGKREEILTFITGQLAFWRKILIKNSTGIKKLEKGDEYFSLLKTEAILRLIRNLQKIYTGVSKNLSAKMALDVLLLAYPHLKSNG